MRRHIRRVSVPVAILGLALAVGGLVAWPPSWASGQAAQLTLDPAPPSSVTAGGGEFAVGVRVAAVTDLASYEWQIAFDPGVVELTDPPASAISDGGFLDDSGRSTFCVPPLLPPSQGLEPGNVRFGCVTSGSGPGVNGNGLLSTIRFVPVGSGSPNIRLVCAGLGNASLEAETTNIPISNVPTCGSPAAGTPEPGTPTPTPTLAPGQPSPTPSGPVPTPTPSGPTPTPSGPTPTPTPLPPGWQAVALAGGCQFEAWTGANGTPAAELADLVGPAGNLRALWAQQPAPLWKGYSPQFPDVSDMGPVDLLDVLAICTTGTGAFSRPII